MKDADVRAVCDVFDVGDPLGPPTEVRGGLVNRMWRLATARGIFAVKEMNRDFGRADYLASFDRAFALEQASFATGVPMSRPIAVTNTGGCLAELPSTDGLPITVRVHAWVDGVKLENSVRHPPEVAARVGSILARIHALKMKSDVTAAEALRVFGEEEWRALVERAESGGFAWAGDLRDLLPVLADLEAYVVAARDDSTELLLSHRDSDPKNFMRTPDGELLLVEWDSAGPVNPRHDLANQALVWAGVHLGDPDAAVARAFVEAYRCNGGVDETFRPTDLAELFGERLGWFRFNVRRALGELLRDETDRAMGENAIRRNVKQLPRFVGSRDAWLAVLRAGDS